MQNIIVPDHGEKQPAPEVIIHLGDERIAQARSETVKYPCPGRKVLRRTPARICQARHGI